MRLTSLIKYIGTLLFSLFICFLNYQVIHAQDSLSIGVAPTSKTLKLNPGDTYSGEIVFWNLSGTSDTYNVFVSGFRQIQNQPGTAVILSDEENAKSLYTASKWIIVSTDTLELEPNKNTKLEYTINVPLDITDGEYNAEIFLISQNDYQLQGTGAFTNLASGMPILIQVGDEFVENAELLSFKTDKKWYEKININFLSTIKNLGDTHITPTGEIIIENIFKQEVARLPFNRNTQSLLRDNIGNYTDNWQQTSYLSPNNAIGIGPMKATLLVTYRSFQPGFASLNAQTTFWIIPWKIILSIIVFLMIIGILRIIKKRKEKKK